MGRKSLTRKQILHYEEPMVRAFRRSLAWLTQHYVLVLTVAGMLLAGGFAWTSWQTHRLNVRETTGRELMTAVDALQTLLNHPPEKKSDLDQQARAIEDQLVGIIHRYPTIPAARYAAFHLAQLHLFRKKYDQAQTYFQQALDLPAPLRDLARYGLAQAFAGRGDLDHALKTLQELRQDPNRVLGEDWILYQEAVILARKGDRTGARKRLQRVMKEFRNSTLISDVRKLKAQLEKSASTSPSESSSPADKEKGNS